MTQAAATSNAPRPATEDAGHQATKVTRELLLSGAFEALIRRSTPDVRLLTEDERAASLEKALAARPGAAAFSVFGYGSLIWNPAIHVAGRRRVVVKGWHRSFCLLTRGGRGTPEYPGLMLGLAEGGSCEGVALDLDSAHARTELAILWRREMVADGYIPRWVPVASPSGDAAGWALAFIINPRGPSFVDGLDDDAVVERLATARGPFGSAAEYLFNTVAGLRAEGIADPYLDAIAARLRARQAGGG